MTLREFLLHVASKYDRLAGLNTPTQELLRRADEEFRAYVPADMIVVGSGGKGEATYTPWVGIFNPDETTDPQDGIYVVYLFSEDLNSVTLTIGQGMEHLSEIHGDSKARAILSEEANNIRAALPTQSIDGLDSTITLASKGRRQRNYEAGAIVARRYEVVSLPADEILLADLKRILELYSLAIDVKVQLLSTRPGAISSPAGNSEANRRDPLNGFKPKDDSDYIAQIVGRQLLKTRRHETLLRRFGEWAIERGFTASTAEHPKDLILRRGGHEWLVEGKVLYLGNATEAVRAALGQLFSYRYFLCDRPEEVRLVGLFSEPVGQGYVDFLAGLDIRSVWWESGRWIGCGTAELEGVVEPAPAGWTTV